METQNGHPLDASRRPHGTASLCPTGGNSDDGDGEVSPARAAEAVGPYSSVGSRGGRGPVWVPSGCRPPAWGHGAPAHPGPATAMVLSGCRRAAAELEWAWCAAPLHQLHCTFPCPSPTALVPPGHRSQTQPQDRSRPAGIASSAGAGSSPRWGRAQSRTKPPKSGAGSGTTWGRGGQRGVKPPPTHALLGQGSRYLPSQHKHGCN